ncbi:fumarylacetoacetate hydrolase family protein [Nocardioides sp. NPDC058538]|uniref:fumarylacetoacetate hydrolase family protein n=1 Tax=Nocardioides sp. NPDC058538 TaxID=3346542 RepID=UPI003652A9ED
MHLLRYATAAGANRVGVRDDDGVLRPLTDHATMADLLTLTRDQLREAVTRPGGLGEPEDPDTVALLPPLDGRGEVWCAGVTYERSRGARAEESVEASVYDRVYAAERPELFPKSPAWRVVTDDEPIGIREDSGHDVPEPELALVVNRHGEIVGLGICDDVSSRSIEGENPIYIPQAKIFSGGCAVAAAVRPAWEVSDLHDLTITIDVSRDGTTVFGGSTSTSHLARRLEDLVSYLCRAHDFPDGVVLATGTGIVPELDFALLAGDVVTIDIEHVGQLRNTVRVGREAFECLAETPQTRPTLGFLQEAR